MGDWFQTIVDKDATPAEAEELAAKVVEMLADRGIIEPTLTDSVLGGTGYGYPLGPRFEEAVQPESIQPPYPPADSYRSLITNGLQVTTTKTVFDSGQGGFDLVCKVCKARMPWGSIHQAWSDAIQEWYDGTGEGIFACPNCQSEEPITEWTFDPPWGFGNLGFMFWNWPQLKESFVEEIGSLLKHRIVFVAGKL